MSTVVRFDRFADDLGSGQLHKNGPRIPLREQSFQVLVAMLERPGQVVTQGDLCRRLWPDTITARRRA
ncbi:MAG: hypothetical protein LUP91_11315 [Methylococcaceae bacterium]|nr:hypothetical protein [Methylococcaceae bacterium]